MKKTILIINFLALFSGTILAQSGSLDETFNGKGFVSGESNFSGFRPSFSVMQADGKFICSGLKRIEGFNYDVTLTRFNENGSVDNSYGEDGIVTTDFGASREEIRTITIQEDGKTLIGANVNLNDKSIIALARYNTNGTLDNTFGENGKVYIDIEESYIDEIKVLSNGKIIIGVDTEINSKTSLGVIRLLNNGKYDNEFGENGVFKYNYQNKNNHITALCIVKNEIIAIGRTDRVSNSDIILFKLTSEGILNVKFGENGIQTFDIDQRTEDPTNAIVIDKKHLLINGVANDIIFTIKVEIKSAKLCNDFGENGIAIINSKDFNQNNEDFSIKLNDIKKLENGEYIVAGYTNQYNGNICSLKFQQNGTIDSTYGNNGMLIVKLNKPSYAYNIHLIDEKHIMFTGTIGQISSIVLARISF